MNDVEVEKIEEEMSTAEAITDDVTFDEEVIEAEKEVKQAEDESRSIAVAACKDPGKLEGKKIIPIVGGSLVPQSLEDLFRIATPLYHPSTMPSHITSKEQFFSIVTFGAFMGLNPMQSLNSIASIKGRLVLHTDGPLACVMASGELEEIEEYFFDKEGKKIEVDLAKGGNPLGVEKVYGAFCRIKRLRLSGEGIGVYTLGLAEKAGLYPAKDRNGKPLPSAPWSAHTNVMLKRRARSLPLKDRFPDVLNGAKIKEYDDIEQRAERQNVGPAKFADEVEKSMKERDVGPTTEPMTSPDK